MIHMKVGDTSPLPVFTLYDANGVADLSSGQTVRFIMAQSSDGDYVTAEDATFVAGSSTAGEVTLSSWTTAANGSSGDFEAELEVTWTDGTITTFPNETFIPIRFHGEASTSS
jgi:hypothetical protein